MDNQVIKSLIGKKCIISGVSFGGVGGTVIQGEIIEVIDNWVKIKVNKKKTELINIEYITRVQMINKHNK
ncbi:DUF6897 domain-containing protein [Haliovirga abyssi]|uniref:DUF6897 domain-containing protein n=1 Tax=Haliovirga abyssi TaxID=2996794 RepID=UPI0027DD897C|nr:hypothetical protein [Haliovirga abyssi]